MKKEETSLGLSSDNNSESVNGGFDLPDSQPFARLSDNILSPSLPVGPFWLFTYETMF